MGNKVEKELRSRFVSLDALPPQSGQPFWLLFQGVCKKTQQDATVFVLNHELARKETPKGGKWRSMLSRGGGGDQPIWDPFIGAKNTVEFLRNVRHPGFPVLVDWYVCEDSRGVFCAVEPLVPFLDAARGLCATEMAVAVADCCSALSHLHNTGVSHNNFSMHAMFFSACPRHRCLVGGLEFAGAVDSQADERLRCSRPFRDAEHGVTPEDNVAVPIAYDQAPAESRDVVGVGRVLRQLIRDVRNRPREGGCGPSAFDAQQAIMQWCLAAENAELTAKAQLCLPPERPSLDSLLSTPLFSRCMLLSVCAGLDKAVVGDAHPQFYSTLQQHLSALPYDVVRERLVPCTLTEPFWCGNGASAFTCHLVAPPPDNPHLHAATARVPGMLLSDAHEQVLEFVFRMLETRRRSARVAVLRVCEILCTGLPAQRLAEVVIPELALGLSDTNADVVQWSIKGVLAAAKAALQDGVEERTREAAAAAVAAHVTPELLLCAASKGLTSVRSAAVLGLAQLLCFDSRAGAQAAFSHALSACLLSFDEDLILHALNAVVMAECSMPFRAIALELLPLLAAVALNPSPKVSEKAGHVMSHLLMSLQEVGGGDAEDFQTPPLLRGCPTTPPPPPVADKRRKRPVLVGELQSDAAVSREPSTVLLSEGTCDTEWNRGLGVLSAHHLPLELARSAQTRRKSTCAAVMDACTKAAAAGGGVYVEPPDSAQGASPLPSPKACRRVVRGVSEEDEMDLESWEKSTFDATGQPFSSTLGATLESQETAEITPGRRKSRADGIKSSGKKRRRRRPAEAAEAAGEEEYPVAATTADADASTGPTLDFVPPVIPEPAPPVAEAAPAPAPAAPAEAPQPTPPAQALSIDDLLDQYDPDGVGKPATAAGVAREPEPVAEEGVKAEAAPAKAKGKLRRRKKGTPEAKQLDATNTTVDWVADLHLSRVVEAPAAAPAKKVRKKKRAAVEPEAAGPPPADPPPQPDPPQQDPPPTAEPAERDAEEDGDECASQQSVAKSPRGREARSTRARRRQQQHAQPAAPPVAVADACAEFPFPDVLRRGSAHARPEPASEPPDLFAGLSAVVPDKKPKPPELTIPIPAVADAGPVSLSPQGSESTLSPAQKTSSGSNLLLHGSSGRKLSLRASGPIRKRSHAPSPQHTPKDATLSPLVVPAPARPGVLSDGERPATPSRAPEESLLATADDDGIFGISSPKLDSQPQPQPQPQPAGSEHPFAGLVHSHWDKAETQQSLFEGLTTVPARAGGAPEPSGGQSAAALFFDAMELKSPPAATEARAQEPPARRVQPPSVFDGLQVKSPASVKSPPSVFDGMEVKAAPQQQPSAIPDLSELFGAAPAAVPPPPPPPASAEHPFAGVVHSHWDDRKPDGDAKNTAGKRR
eukprot:TRINITY_DN6168_c0_g4_i1.p1 TRINITY_DN6168_c0_g4~~TRINITY_DN6168_c0_g4_i1.p1  ORF type:complete len:1390 (+),score=412.40 TRINITY_DN6168_c0_g4_i1:67-4236(+)